MPQLNQILNQSFKSPDQQTEPRPTFDVDLSLLSDAQLEALDELKGEERDNYLSQLANAQQRQREREKKEAERKDSERRVREYNQRIRVPESVGKSPESVAEWFEKQLSTRVKTKNVIRLSRYHDNAFQLLSIAYSRRVASDRQVADISGQVECNIKKAAEWMVSQNTKPGLLIRGLPGVGKSTLMRAIIDVFAIVDSRLTTEVSATDIANAGLNDKKLFKEFCDAPMLAIDDLGTEPPTIKSYGNEVSPMVDLITERHRKLRFTLITTNLVKTPDGDEIINRYGIRIQDRLNELCNELKYGGEMQSFRNKKPKQNEEEQNNHINQNRPFRC